LIEARPAIGGDQVPRLDQDDVAELQIERVHRLILPACGIRETLRHGVRAHAAQGVGLRLAAPLGDGLGEIREQHREPQPGGDLAREERDAAAGEEVAQEQDRDHE
jgi:hypothetical protein